jgi:hypothetical protein
VRETDGVGDVVRPRSVESRVHFDDELDPGVVGAPHVVWPMEPAVLTLDSAVQEHVVRIHGRRARRASALLVLLPLSRRSFSPWI